MTTSISAVNAGSSAASEAITKKSSLSLSTQNELEALGITATEGMTESEAQAKIAAAQQENESENQGGQQAVGHHSLDAHFSRSVRSAYMEA